MTKKKSKKQPLTLQKIYPYILVIGSVIGVLAAGILMNDKVKLLVDHTFNPNCNLNPIFSCTSVLKSKEASAFGFPNPIIGLAGFGMVLAAGMSLLAGGKFKRWWWLTLQGGTIFGLLFVHWLFRESVFEIGALCLYCMVVWTVTIAIFWYTLLHNLREGFIKTPIKLKAVISFAQTNHIGILILWYIAIAATILHHFWYFFGPN